MLHLLGDFLFLGLRHTFGGVEALLREIDTISDFAECMLRQRQRFLMPLLVRVMHGDIKCHQRCQIELVELVSEQFERVRRLLLELAHPALSLERLLNEPNCVGRFERACIPRLKELCDVQVDSRTLDLDQVSFDLALELQLHDVLN